MFYKPQSNSQPRYNHIAIPRRNHVSKTCSQHKSTFFNSISKQQNKVFYITLYLQNRKCLLGQIVKNDMLLSQTGLIVQECWYDLPILYPTVQLDMFIVMPNHLHGLVLLTESKTVVNSESKGALKNPDISKIATDFISISSQFVSEQENLPAESVWRSQFETEQVMNESRLDLLRDYISDNPPQWLHDPMNPTPSAEQSGIFEIANKYTQN